MDLTKVGEHINKPRTNILNLQHEYGVFGGEWGEHAIAFLEELQKPVVMTLHTMWQEPS